MSPFRLSMLFVEIEIMIINQYIQNIKILILELI